MPVPKVDIILTSISDCILHTPLRKGTQTMEGIDECSDNLRWADDYEEGLEAQEEGDSYKVHEDNVAR